MSDFLKLLQFEMKRFKKMYLLLFLLIFVIQMGVVLIFTLSYKTMLKKSNMDIDMYGLFNLEIISYSFPFLLPILIGLFTMLFYTFFIWYRDWSAKNTFMYRLLTLPTSRFNIYLAKLCTMIFFVFGLVAYQMVLLYVYKYTINLIIPSKYIVDVKVTSFFTQTIIPTHFMDFMMTYIGIIVGIIIIFTMILLERSFRVTGIVLAVFYLIGMLVLIVLPDVVQFFTKSYFYTEEMFAMKLVSLAIASIISILISRYLLNKKVTV